MKETIVFFPGKKRSRPSHPERLPDPSRTMAMTVEPGLSVHYRLAIGIVCACEQCTLDNGKN